MMRTEGQLVQLVRLILPHCQHTCRHGSALLGMPHRLFVGPALSLHGISTRSPPRHRIVPARRAFGLRHKNRSAAPCDLLPEGSAPWAPTRGKRADDKGGQRRASGSADRVAHGHRRDRFCQAEADAAVRAITGIRPIRSSSPLPAWRWQGTGLDLANQDTKSCASV